MKFLLAEKREMTQKFGADGTVIPVTKLLAEPSVITQVKTKAKDGYVALQLGYGHKRILSKPLQGHLKDLGKFRYLREFHFRTQDDVAQAEAVKVGDRIAVTVFSPGEHVQVTGTSKGKGFQGVVKRHHFAGGPASHGHKDQLRMPGSIGAKGPAHVFKGLRMAGRMGGDRVTVKNLVVVAVDPEKNELFVRGAVPGARGQLILVSGPGAFSVEIVAESKPAVPDQEQPAVEAGQTGVEPAVEAESAQPAATAEQK